MKVARKLLATGAASLVLAGGIVALPSTLPAGATYGSHGHGWHRGEPDSSYVLKTDANAFYEVTTKVDPGHHVLLSIVTNKSSTPLTPAVTFNGTQAITHSGNQEPINPGESRKYVHFFSGNNFTLDVQVSADGAEPLTSSAVVNLSEPVSFKTTNVDNTNKTITGDLTNNTAESQTVYIKTHKKNKVTQTLAANETKTVTVSSDTYHRHDNHKHHDKQFVRLKVATESGYDSKYLIRTDYHITQPTPVKE